MTVTTMPHNQERYRQQGKTTLFYTNVDFHTAHKGAPPPVVIKGRMTVKMPKLGEALILDDVYAKDVEFKTQYNGKSAFTRYENGGEAMAAYIKEAQAKGLALDPASIEKLKTQKVLMDASDDELISTLKQRFPDAPPELLAMLKQDRQAKVEKAAPEPEEAEVKLNPRAAAPLVAAKKEK